MSIDKAEWDRFLQWCYQHEHLNGLEYRHHSFGRGYLFAIQGTHERPVIGFKPDQGTKVQLSLESIAERVRHGKGISEKDRFKLLKIFKERLLSKVEPSAAAQKHGSAAAAQIAQSLLYRQICLHHSLILENPSQFLAELKIEILGQDWARNLRDRIRREHPSGFSKRPHKRELLLSKIEKCIVDAITEWWSQIESHEAAAVLAHIDELPERHSHKELHSKALRKLASLPYSSHADFNHSLWKFYDSCFDSLLELPAQSAGPSVLAYAGWLACNSGSGKKNCLRVLDLCEHAGLSEFQPLIGFLRFVTSDPPSLSGSMRFTELDETDLFLAACYYPKNDKLRNILEWHSEEINSQLGDHAYNDFLVQGVQPRVAELAFQQIRLRIADESDIGMVDLNRQAVDAMSSPWVPTKHLPDADWQGPAGTKFDVKSNLYFRKYSGSVGLRGFAIKRPENECVTYSGIVFFETSSDHCEWVYVGELSKESYKAVCGFEKDQSGRVLPFVFQMPEPLRFSASVSAEEAQRSASLLADEKLKFGWAIAARQSFGRQAGDPASGPQVTNWFFERFSEHGPQYSVEFSMWKAATEATLQGCSLGRVAEIDAMHHKVISILRAGVLPVRLARIKGTTLLERWIEDVLRPLVNNFDRICCPVCKGREISLDLHRITAGGAIFGTMKCKGECRNEFSGLTILSHCHACRCYPLIIGKNKICEKCYGLICNHDGLQGRCRACKKNCEGNSRSNDSVDGTGNY